MWWNLNFPCLIVYKSQLKNNYKIYWVLCTYKILNIIGETYFSTHIMRILMLRTWYFSNILLFSTDIEIQYRNYGQKSEFIILDRKIETVRKEMGLWGEDPNPTLTHQRHSISWHSNWTVCFLDQAHDCIYLAVQEYNGSVHKFLIHRYLF